MSKPTPAPNPAPDHIVVISRAPEAMTTPVRQRIARVFPQTRIDVAASLARAASENPEARIVLAVLDPVEAIATRLAEHGTKPEIAAQGANAILRAWTQEMAPVLEATRSLRRRLWLVDARAMADGRPQALSPEPESAAVEAPSLTPPPPAQYLALADMLIRSDVQATRLAAEIAALRRGPGGLPLDLDMAFAGLISPAQETTELALLRETLALVQTELDANAEALAAAQQDLAAQDAIKAEAARLQAEVIEQERLRQEVGLLRETLALVQAELEAKAKALAAAQNDLAAQDALKAEAARLRQEVGLLRETLDLMQTELETNVKAAAVAQQERLDHGVLKARLAAAERQLAEGEEFLRLRQEVLAAEILKLNGFLVDERAHHAQEAQAAQGEIALLHDRLQAGQAEIDQLQGQLHAAQAEIGNLNGQLLASQAETASLQNQLQVALHEVDLLHESTSWQVTAPLRAVKRRLSGQ